MAKILVFNGSPRKNGMTSNLISELVKGAKSHHAEVIEYDLNDPGVRGCQGCYYCRSNDGCSVKTDTLAPMYEQIKEADAIVVGSPIYFYQISGQTKLWLDRMFPMVGSPGLTARFPGKKVVTIFSQGSADTSYNRGIIDEFNKYINSFGWDIEETIICGGSTDPGYTMPEEMLQQAFKAGEKLAQ